MSTKTIFDTIKEYDEIMVAVIKDEAMVPDELVALMERCDDFESTDARMNAHVNCVAARCDQLMQREARLIMGDFEVVWDKVERGEPVDDAEVAKLVARMLAWPVRDYGLNSPIDHAMGEAYTKLLSLGVTV